MKRQLLTLFGFVLLAACGSGEEPATTTSDAAAAPQSTAEVHADDDPVATAITGIPPAVDVIDQEIAYGSTADSLLEGYFVLPADVTDPVPGVIMIHEWWGLNDNIRAMARRLAGEGYAVLAVDLYGGQTAASAAEAQQLMARLQSARPAAIDNLSQAHAYLEEFAFAPRVATLGWCLGGGWSLEAGIELADEIDAIVMFYGQVVSDRVRLGLIDAPLLGHFAELDASIPLEDAVQFRRDLRELGKTAEVLVYPGVDHAFANPSGNAYNHAAATEAWETTLEFLDARLR